MRLLPSDPDIETIVNRINSGDLNLQPEFQRGEVWSKLKKQRLIDSILRDWHVPPIHVIENPKSRKQEVLDGQQRLAAIRDFVQGSFSVDGSIQPYDEGIKSLDGMLYRELAGEWRRRFDQFTIRVFRIVDFRPSEPGELFFRLNQPSSLTGAEQRNAFFGPVREQIKDIVEELDERGIGKEVLGFSNWRMAYDDVFSRVALAIERKSIAEKITSADLVELYRQEQPLGGETTELIRRAVNLLADAMPSAAIAPKFNKATLFSWLMFLVRGELHGYRLEPKSFSRFLRDFQVTRDSAFHESDAAKENLAGVLSAGFLFSIYESRSAARVADVSSVLLRDAVIWVVNEHFAASLKIPAIPNSIHLEALHSALNSRVRGAYDETFAKNLIDSGWGQLR
jgi:hypothetical protein